MNAHVKWFNEEHSIILQSFAKGWTWEDFNEIALTSIEMMEGVDHPVSIIADYLEGKQIPRDGLAMNNARKVMANLPSNWNLLVVISDNNYITMLVDMFRRISMGRMGKNTYSANSIETALKIIEEKSPSKFT